MTEANTPIEGKSSRFRWFTAAIITLMIVLMVYSGQTANRQAHMEHGVLIGTSNAGDVMSQDSRYASSLLDQLSIVHVVVPSGDNTAPRLVPLLIACWGEPIVRDMKAHPEALFLALREARKVSPGVNPYSLGSIDPEQQLPDSPGIFNSGRVAIGDLRPLPTSPLGSVNPNYLIELRIIQHGKERVTQVSPNALPPLDQQNLYVFLNDFLTLQSAASLPLNAIKPTTPMLDRMIAQRFQSFSLQLAPVDVRPLIAKVPEPTDDQLRKQLETYAAFIPGRPSADNSFGFGYRVPDRVKLELISFKRADVRRAVEAEKTPYEWEVAARIAYAKDPSLAGPTTQPTSQPTAAPTVAPFEAVKDRVIPTTIDRATDARSAEIEKAIRAPMMLDYQQWANANNGRGGATTAPASVAVKSSLGEAYNSLAYLQKLAAQVQAKFKVQPTVEDYTDRLRDVVGLELLGGFNEAMRPLPPDLARRIGRTNELITGPEYAINFSKDLLDPSAIETLGGLILERYRPSERLELNRNMGREREVFYFRITEADRSHPGTDIDPIREQLKSDWRVAEAQKLAVAEAQKAVDAIKSGTDFNTAVAAAAPGASVIRAEVGPFYSAPPEPNALGLSLPAYAQFGTRVTDALLDEKVDLAALDVPLAGKVYVAKRLGMRGEWTSDDDIRSLRQQMRSRFAVQMAQPRTDANIVGVAAGDVAATWLDSKSIFERSAYKPAREDQPKD
jgi:hypothetical protein